MPASLDWDQKQSNSLKITASSWKLAVQIATGDWKQGENSANHVITEHTVCDILHMPGRSLKNVYVSLKEVKDF